jgi:hypothetical protein
VDALAADAFVLRRAAICGASQPAITQSIARTWTVRVRAPDATPARAAIASTRAFGAKNRAEMDASPCGATAMAVPPRARTIAVSRTERIVA